MKRILPLFVVIITVSVLFGWYAEIDWLKSFFSPASSMKVNTALAHLFLALALIFKKHRWSFFLAAVTFFIGSTALIQDFYKINLGIDELFFLDIKNHNSIWPPGRPSPTTALCFLAVSIAFFLRNSKSFKTLVVSQFFSLIVWVLSFQSIVCFLEGVNTNYGSVIFTQMAVHTALAFVLISSELIVNGPNIGIASILKRKTFAGRIIQLLLGIGILLPPTLIWFKILGVKFGWWTEEFGAVLVIIFNVVFYSFIIYLAGVNIIKAEEVQIGAQKDLRYSIQLRDDFLSLASHELKTPLTSIKLQNQMLQRELLNSKDNFILSEKIIKFINLNEKQINRLNRLVDAMLDISRIDAKKIILHKEVVELVSLINEVSDSMAASFHVNECIIKISPTPPIFGEWDRLRVDQIFLNLLSNACKYGQHSEIIVSFSIANENAIVEIANGGKGIAHEDLERIFKRFERGTDINETTGLGLGLYITRTLIELHGGSIAVHSKLGEGATFRITLPLGSATPQ